MRSGTTLIASCYVWKMSPPFWYKRCAVFDNQNDKKKQFVAWGMTLIFFCLFHWSWNTFFPYNLREIWIFLFFKGSNSTGCSQEIKIAQADNGIVHLKSVILWGTTLLQTAFRLTHNWDVGLFLHCLLLSKFFKVFHHISPFDPN